MISRSTSLHMEVKDVVNSFAVFSYFSDRCSHRARHLPLPRSPQHTPTDSPKETAEDAKHSKIYSQVCPPRGELFSFPSDFLSRNTGALRPGEMVLVLGAPGLGCTTFLKVITNECGARPPKASGSSISDVFWVPAGGGLGHRPAMRGPRVRWY